ncbi:hypothetical protein AB0H43_12965 [Hamadaea sp. NPDC050747]|uniref:hypothetical protein n=1 Tax=Hamadaea sp. NPDC050747 TaxID=3155789 RepID=UPI0033E2163D
MGSSEAGNPWRRVSGVRQVVPLTVLVCHAMWHWIARPYKAGRPARRFSGLWSRMRSSAGSAVYDTVINHFIKGYAELTHSRPRPETGALVILLYRLMAAFDDEYERRIQVGGSMGFDDVFAADQVQDHLKALSAFLAAYEERQAIRQFLETYTAENYDRYLALTRSADSDVSAESHLAMIELDSGGFLVCTAQVIAIFNGHRVSPEVLAQFAHLGVVGKLADDMVDVWADMREGSANALAGMVRSTPDEARILSDQALHRRRASYRWWKKHCPASFARFTEVLAHHRDEVTSRSLGLAGDLMLLPAAWGGPETRKAQSERAEIRV